MEEDVRTHKHTQNSWGICAGCVWTRPAVSQAVDVSISPRPPPFSLSLPPHSC